MNRAIIHGNRLILIRHCHDPEICASIGQEHYTPRSIAERQLDVIVIRKIGKTQCITALEIRYDRFQLPRDPQHIFTGYVPLALRLYKSLSIERHKANKRDAYERAHAKIKNAAG